MKIENICHSQWSVFIMTNPKTIITPRIIKSGLKHLAGLSDINSLMMNYEAALRQGRGKEFVQKLKTAIGLNNANVLPYLMIKLPTFNAYPSEESGLPTAIFNIISGYIIFAVLNGRALGQIVVNVENPSIQDLVNAVSEKIELRNVPDAILRKSNALRAALYVVSNLKEKGANGKGSVGTIVSYGLTENGMPAFKPETSRYKDIVHSFLSMYEMYYTGGSWSQVGDDTKVILGQEMTHFFLFLTGAFAGNVSGVVSKASQALENSNTTFYDAVQAIIDFVKANYPSNNFNSEGKQYNLSGVSSPTIVISSSREATINIPINTMIAQRGLAHLSKSSASFDLLEDFDAALESGKRLELVSLLEKSIGLETDIVKAYLGLTYHPFASLYGSESKIFPLEIFDVISAFIMYAVLKNKIDPVFITINASDTTLRTLIDHISLSLSLGTETNYQGDTLTTKAFDSFLNELAALTADENEGESKQVGIDEVLHALNMGLGSLGLSEISDDSSIGGSAYFSTVNGFACRYVASSKGLQISGPAGSVKDVRLMEFFYKVIGHLVSRINNLLPAVAQMISKDDTVSRILLEVARNVSSPASLKALDEYQSAYNINASSVLSPDIQAMSFDQYLDPISTSETSKKSVMKPIVLGAVAVASVAAIYWAFKKKK